MQTVTALDDFQKRKEQFIRENTPAWRECGSKYRAIRQAAGLSLAELARVSGFSTGKLRDFEAGMPGYCTKAVEKAYEAAARLRMAEIEKVLNR